MSISYLAITRNATILAQCAIESGDFDTIVSDILAKSHLQNQRIQIDRGGYRFYIYHNKNGINTLMGCDQSVQSTHAFSILEHIYKQFVVSFPFEWGDAEPFEFQGEFEPQMRQIYENFKNNDSNSGTSDKDLQNKSSVMTSLQNTLLQGDSLKNLQPKAEPKIDRSVHRSARWLQRRMFFQKFKYHFIALAVMFVLFFVMLVFFIRQFKK